MSEGQDTASYLRTSHLEGDLGKRGARGAVVMLASQGLKVLLQIASTVVLARLLTPDDFGVIAMAATVMNFVMMFKDLGLSQATIQREHLTQSQVTSLFWVNVLLSVVLMVIVIALAPLVALLYHEPRLAEVVVALSVGFVLTGLSVQSEALLKRQMRFIRVAAVDVSATAIGFAAGVVSALLGAGYWALVVMRLVQQATARVGVSLACGWRPGWPSWDPSAASLVRFGGHITGFQLANYFARNADNVLIGWYWGASSLGLYDRAYRLFTAPLQEINAPLGSVMVPMLSRLRDRPAQYRRAYLGVIEKISMITMPLAAFAMVTSDWLIPFAFGEQWRDAAPIFAFLSLAMINQPVTNTTGWLFISQNRTSGLLRWGMLGGALTTASFIIALPFGPIAMAGSYACLNVFVLTPLLFWYVGREGPVSMKDLYGAVRTPLLLGVMVMASLYALRMVGLLPGESSGLVCAIGVTVILTVVTLTALPSGRKVLADALKLMRMISYDNKLNRISNGGS